MSPKKYEGWVETTFSRGLSGRRNHGTKPELALRRALHAQGARFRLQRAIADKVTADIVFPRQRVAVFVDGCFWHGCPIHGRTAIVSSRGPNASKWAAKLARIQERDRRATRLAEEAGWRVLRLWECEVNSNPDAAAANVLAAVRGTTSVSKTTPAPEPSNPDNAGIAIRSTDPVRSS